MLFSFFFCIYIFFYRNLWFLEMSPKMQGMCIGVKSTFVSVAVYLFCFHLG